MKKIKTLSVITLILISSIFSVYKINNVERYQISWDVLGYYLYLPATFIHHDPTLKDISWLTKANEDHHLAGNLYMVSQNEKGEPMYFFLMGMAFFYLPFFLLATIYCSMCGFAVDGFSLPYQYFLVIGGLIYTIIGLVFFRKILLQFFSEKLTSLLMILIAFGTNYISELTTNNLGTVNVIFMLTTIIIWNTIKWHETYAGKRLIIICVCITLATLVKPTEVFVVMLPLLWGVTSIETAKQKLAKLWESRKHIFIAIPICLIIVLPQMLYWHHKTGMFIYDSYKNAGVGLDWWSPHIINVLFSYRKGWLVYTPLMAFSLIGFYFLYKKNKQLFFASAIYFLVCFYIISSWTEWWYGSAYSIRPLIATYPILGICLGYFLQFINKSNTVVKVIISQIILFFVFLNQFQWWQYKNYILDPYRTTKEYYWATFLKTYNTDDDWKLKSVYRDFEGKKEFSDKDRYQKTLLISENFEEDDKGNQVENDNHFHRFNEGDEFFSLIETPYEELTQKDHVWIKVSMDIRFPENFQGQKPRFVNTMLRKVWFYGYSDTEIKSDSIPNHWRRVEEYYLTPEIRSTKDIFKSYIWNPGKRGLDIDNIKLEVYKRKF
ncbi:MAG: hypothetical protein ACYDCN_00605 [Bacteroidia bacterium]